MTRAELLELIARGENSFTEFISHPIDGFSFAREVASFANLRGGRLLIGVDGGGCVSGFRASAAAHGFRGDSRARAHDEVQEWVAATCRDKIHPALYPRFDVVPNVEPGQDVAVVTVDRGWTVHKVRYERRPVCYVRAGRTHREASFNELYERLPRQGAYRMELRPVSGTSVAHLDRRRLVDYFSRVREQKAPSNQTWGGESGEWEAGWEALLINTLMLREEAPHSVNVAALMLFGKDASRFLPQAKIEAAAYDGTRKASDVAQRRTLRGAIVPLHDAGGSLVERGLVERAMDFVVQSALGGLPANAARSGRNDLPLEAVREAILNAIIHRDYEIAAGIEINIYTDRLEVVSPGRLANDNTVERMKAGYRRARNELLRDVMRDYGYMDHIGLGVPRKIVRAMREHNGTEPELVPEEDRFTVRLWRQPALRPAA